MTHADQRHRFQFKGRPAREIVQQIITRLQLKAGDNHARFREYVYMQEVLASNRNLENVGKEVETMSSTTKLSDLPSYHLGRERGEVGRDFFRHERKAAP